MRIKQIRFKYKGTDILPYFLIFSIIFCLTLGMLGQKEVIDIPYWKFFGIMGVVLMNLGILNYIKKINVPKGVNLDSLKSTSDIRTPTFSFKGFIDRGQNIAFVKFYFNQDEIYLYYRSFIIKIFYGPFVIKSFENATPGYFYIKEFIKLNKYEARIKIGTKEGLTNYGLLLRNFTERDFNLLKENFEKLGMHS